MPSVFDIPRYREAVEREALDRDAAFLGVTSTVGEFELVPMTLRHLLILRRMRSPFLSGAAPGSPYDIKAFLWLLSPDYTPAGGRARRRFVKRCRQFEIPRKPLLHTPWAMERWKRRSVATLMRCAEITGQIRAYLADTMTDWPAARAGHNVEQAPFYSEAVGIAAVMAREYGWAEAWTLNAPLKAAFQYLQEIRIHAGEVGFNSRSDAVLREGLKAGRN